MKSLLVLPDDYEWELELLLLMSLGSSWVFISTDVLVYSLFIHKLYLVTYLLSALTFDSCFLFLLFVLDGFFELVASFCKVC